MPALTTESSPGPTSARTGLEPHPEDLGPIKLIGLGGTGGIVARYLLMYLAALDVPTRAVLIDGDDFESKNAARMWFSRLGNKASVVLEDVDAMMEDAPITLSAIEQYVTPENIGQLIHDGDVVLLAVDNHATRKLVGEHCAQKLANVCLISGGNDGVGHDGSGRAVHGTYGNVQVHIRRDGCDQTPSLFAYHPEIATPADQLPTSASCSEAVASTPQIIFANLASASAMLNAFYLHVCRELDYSEACFDIRDALMRPLELPVPKKPSRQEAG